MKEIKFRQLLKKPNTNQLPIHANYWKLFVFEDEFTIKYVTSKTHHTKNYAIHSLYKSISQCIRITQ